MNKIILSLKDNFILKAIVLFSLATIAFYLLTEHKAHLLAYSSYVFFFAYILLHFFMCRRHGGHGEHGGHCGHSDGKHNHEEAKKRIENATEGHDDKNH